jgi:hypothetical protein
MGTNYYETAGTDPCPHCGRGGETETLHIGKSSAGWVFALCIYPERGIHTLADWQERWAVGGQIRDEYGHAIDVPYLLRNITERSHPNGLRIHRDGDATSRLHQPGDPTYQLRTDTDFS